MNKKKLTSFINKYYLGDTADSAVWKIVDNVLSVDFKLEDDTLAGKILLDNFQCENAEFGIYETSQLLSLLNILEDDIEFELNKRGDVYNILHLQDTKTKIRYMLSDINIITTKPPQTINLPDFNINIKFDAAIIQKFIKAAHSMTTVKSFSISANELIDEIKFIITDNSNIVYLEVETDKVKDCEHLTFSIEHLVNIFNNNKDFNTVECQISTAGLFKIGFTFTDITSTYYLVAEQ